MALVVFVHLEKSRHMFSESPPIEFASIREMRVKKIRAACAFRGFSFNWENFVNTPV